ncbi:hypothetical protein NIIDNTM18_20770 [Mycolicibacterium litorale]|uniref:Uncharacterized protein n=1 Tax=Mycolicibacterium litorale TaxID=758802 RepID=A0A6S6P2V9_9MYCO|nr:hypothetical protein [Mycolicibacterium litorale]BCI52799.1 hypothetical protein NIIDNTM18_20770 [Mycolicibacterium litorale]
MHAHELIHPWQLATAWATAHRRPQVVVLDAHPAAPHWWSGTHILPESRSHYYPSRCGYLESSEMSRMMGHL